ncbi:MAG: GNAT family N-acetyltransferase [Flavobacteriaceae bacterium]
MERKNRSEFTYAIREPLRNKVVGLIIIKEIDWDQKTAELAYAIGKAFAGQGWMSRAIKRVVVISFEELQLQTLHIVVHQSNLASIAVAEKCGFGWVKTLPNEHILPGEAALDMELYLLHGKNRLTK